MDSLTDTFGPVIHTYSTKQAIKDGFLVDISTSYPKLVEQSPVKLPVIFTSALWELVKQAVESDNCNDYEGVLWDIIFTFALNANANKEVDRLIYDVIITGVNKEKGLVKIKVKINYLDFDNPKPALFFDVVETGVNNNT